MLVMTGYCVYHTGLADDYNVTLRLEDNRVVSFDARPGVLVMHKQRHDGKGVQLLYTMPCSTIGKRGYVASMDVVIASDRKTDEFITFWDAHVAPMVAHLTSKWIVETRQKMLADSWIT